MGRRDVLAEIIEKRGRGSVDTSRIDAFARRIKQLDRAMQDLLATGDPNSVVPHPELGRYFPIALVASIEGYFRIAVANLIDHGTPFIERIGKLRDISVSIEAAAAIQTKKISLGEYVAHFLSFSSLDDINRSLSSLLGFDFLEQLVTSEFHLYDDEPPVQLEEARKDFVVAVKELFLLMAVEDMIDWSCIGEDGADLYHMLTASHAGETVEEAVKVAEQLTGDYAGPVQVVEF